MNKTNNLAEYNKIHLWMLALMVIMQIGIFADYWGDFTDNKWAVHVHYWTATLWYVFLITQPYYATHGQMEKHRTQGIIAMFVVGGVVITSFSMLHGDIIKAHRSAEMPERFGPATPDFFYGVLIAEMLSITAFCYAIIQSIIHRKSLRDHVWWLVASSFYIIKPALGRGINNLWIYINREDWPNINIMIPDFIASMLIIALLLFYAQRYKKLSHPATLLGAGLIVFSLFLKQLGSLDTVQSFLQALIKV
ncbi:MAG: hypothetical protein OEY00_13335 [Gammaproteobacteria bacterium]|nr:hypothetical protein [Gammaproteobacteria bacterium]